MKSREITILTLALAGALVFLLAPAEARAQDMAGLRLDQDTEEPPDQEQPEPEPEPTPAPAGGEEDMSDRSPIEIGLRYDLWVTDSDFTSRTATEKVEITSSGVAGLDLLGRYHATEDIAIQIGLEFSLDSNIDMFVFTAGALYDLDWLDFPLDTHVEANILIGTLDLSDVHGSFSAGFGIEAGLGLEYSLSELLLPGLSVNLDLMLRYLQFSFDEDSDVVSADDSFGGFGLRFLFGVEYRF